MSVPAAPDNYNEPPRSRVNAGQVWTAGLATAIVAALIAVVGILISRWLFHVPILAPSNEGAWGSANTAYYALAAACVALAATALLHLLMVGTPEPTRFLNWILGLVTVAAVVYPDRSGRSWLPHQLAAAPRSAAGLQRPPRLPAGARGLPAGPERLPGGLGSHPSVLPVAGAAIARDAVGLMLPHRGCWLAATHLLPGSCTLPARDVVICRAAGVC
jgi:hypothetical protein